MVNTNPSSSGRAAATSVATKAKVMLVDDHPVLRQGLASLIDGEPDLAVVGGAETTEQALRLVRQLRPDVVVVDIILGEGSGLDLIKQIRESDPDLPVLALSMYDESLYAERALRAGAKGYVMKKEAMDKVMTAIRRVLAGEMYISEKMAAQMVQKFIGRGRDAKPGSPLETLSDREFEVFNLIAQGVGPTQIAQRLGVSVKTIETHREHVKDKLGLKSGTELIRFALQWAMQQPQQQ
jgi:DNA-binding NarL/FixJ family response regulator